MTTARVHLPSRGRWITRSVDATRRRTNPVESVGFVAGFVWSILSSIPFVLRHYRSQTAKVATDLTWGRGAILVGGGTVPVLIVLGIAVGGGIGLQAFASLDMIGLGPVTGVVSAFATTRELAPIAAAIGFSAQAGCRMTAEIGAMRISEEIDAIEAFGLRSIPFVVTTRVIAGAVAIVPTFLAALVLGYLACAAVVVILQGESWGVYNHYFEQFAHGSDIMAAVLKVVVFVVTVIGIHCYYGFFASGGPEGVGVASGRAVRSSFVAIIAIDMVMTVMLWGINSPLEFTG